MPYNVKTEPHRPPLGVHERAATALYRELLAAIEQGKPGVEFPTARRAERDSRVSFLVRLGMVRRSGRFMMRERG